MEIEELRQWIFVVSACFSMVSVAGGIILAVAQYRLKLKEEERLASSSRAEIDVRLTSSFSELMDLAMGRRQHVLSEGAVKELFAHGFISKDDFNADFKKPQVGALKLSEYAVVVLPVGRSSQFAAIAAIATLARRHPVLREAAICGLERLLTSIAKDDTESRMIVEQHLLRAKERLKIGDADAA